MSKFCRNCGEEHGDKSNFCSYCGTSFEMTYLNELRGEKRETELKKEERKNNRVVDAMDTVDFVNVLDNRYDIYDVYLIEEKGSKGWIITVIDFGIFFILLFTIGFIAAFIISTVVALILQFILNPKNKYDKFFMSLRFEENKLLFESKTNDKSSFTLPYSFIINVKGVKMDGLFNKQISLSTSNNSFIFELANYSIENLDELIAKINNLKNREYNTGDSIQ